MYLAKKHAEYKISQWIEKTRIIQMRKITHKKN